MQSFPLLTLCLLTLASLTLSIETRSAFARKSTHKLPPGWLEVEPAPPSHVLKLHIALKHGNLDIIEEHLYQISDPKHARYGQHLTQEQVRELQKPSYHCWEAVHEWLEDNGILPAQLSYSPGNTSITVSLPISIIEQLLDAEYYTYRHNDGSILYRTLNWSLPRHLHDHVSVIQPTNSFMGKRVAPKVARKPISKRSTNAQAFSGCDPDSVTPQCIMSLYNIPNPLPTSTGSSCGGVAYLEFDGSYTNNTGVFDFLSAQSSSLAATAALTMSHFCTNSAPCPTLNADGPTFQTEYSSTEDNLHAGLITSLVYPIPVQSYSFGGNDSLVEDASDWLLNSGDGAIEPWLSWIEYMLDLKSKELPEVISISYGDAEDNVPRDYAIEVCNGFGALSALGVSILVSTGIYGVGFSPCQAIQLGNKPAFLPNFPASCPYVTAVGSTQGFGEHEIVYTEAMVLSSSGGFSNVFRQPQWQNSVVNDYINNLPTGFNRALFNPEGRAFPDVAAQGVNLSCSSFSSACPATGDGSVDIWASIIARLNHALFMEGKPPLGFLNPFLYGGSADKFNDIQSGTLAGCEDLGPMNGTKIGFPALKGWDAASGFGSPNFNKLSAAALSATPSTTMTTTAPTLSTVSWSSLNTQSLLSSENSALSSMISADAAAFTSAAEPHYTPSIWSEITSELSLLLAAEYTMTLTGTQESSQEAYISSLNNVLTELEAQSLPSAYAATAT